MVRLRSQGPRTPVGQGMPSGSQRMPPAATAGLVGTSVYTVGPGTTSGPRSTTPWQAGPRSFVGPSGAPRTISHLQGGFVDGGSVWGPRPQDQGFPKGSAFPGYPDSWDTPWMTKGDDHWNNILTRRISTVWSCVDRKSTRLNSSHVEISYAVFCLKK